jgi:outer membrane protein TolC
MRWKSCIGVLALLLAAAAGCKQRIFMTQEVWDTYQGLVPANLPNNPNVGCEPTIPPATEPENLYNLERFRIRYLSLKEAIAIALEQGTVGQPSLLFPGISLDNLVQFAGPGVGVSGSDSIRVLAMDPATIGATIEQALSKFDALFVGSMVWNVTDQPIGTTAATIQAAGAASLTAIEQESANFTTALLKPLPTGGIAGITFNVPYTYTNLPARVNPAYQPSVQLQFEQPLLQGFGVEINQISPTHPGSIAPALNGVPNALTLAASEGQRGLSPTNEGILVSRIRFNQSRAEFERNVNQMLLNVETAYWNLYGSYWALYSREQGVRFAFESWRIVRAQYEAGRASLADAAQAQGQYELFRSQRLQAIDTVLDNERQLRGLLGMQVADGTRLVPSDAPVLALYQPDWATALEITLRNRPELYMARQDVKANQMTLVLAKNQLLPDLRVFAQYDANSIGSRLDGGSQDNAFRNLASDTFNDWQVGLRLTIPIGYRFAHATVRQAQLRLARSYLVLQDQELKAERFLGLQWRRLSSQYEQIKANRAQREAFATQLQTRYQQYLAGRGTLDILLEAQRFWADALATEYASIVAYNNALCGFEFAKGTIMQHDSIHIAEGPVPACVQERAVEHFRERNEHALLLRTRAAESGCMADKVQPAGPINVYPQVPADADADADGAALPQAWQRRPPLKDAEPLPGADADVPPGQKVGPVEVPREQLLPAPTEGTPPASQAPSPAPAPSPQAPAADAAAPQASMPQSPEIVPAPPVSATPVPTTPIPVPPATATQGAEPHAPEVLPAPPVSATPVPAMPVPAPQSTATQVPDPQAPAQLPEVPATPARKKSRHKPSDEFGIMRPPDDGLVPPATGGGTEPAKPQLPLPPDPGSGK